MSVKKQLSCILPLFMMQASFAGTMGPIVDPLDFYVLTVSAGPAWQDAGRAQQFFLTPEIEKRYVPNKSSSALADVDIFLGVQRSLNSYVNGQIGVAVGVTSDARLSGIVWDDADPLFDNHSYSYRVQHTHVALKGKLLGTESFYRLTPWVSGSVGVGFNRANDYTNTPLIFEALATPNFASHTETTFTYNVGAGVQTPIAKHWTIGIGYEFADWGKSRLDRAAEQTLNRGLSLNHLYTNGFLVGLTYSC